MGMGKTRTETRGDARSLPMPAGKAGNIGGCQRRRGTGGKFRNPTFFAKQGKERRLSDPPVSRGMSGPAGRKATAPPWEDRFPRRSYGNPDKVICRSITTSSYARAGIQVFLIFHPSRQDPRKPKRALTSAPLNATLSTELSPPHIGNR